MIETNERIETIREKIEIKKMHYYGDTLRHLYLVIAIIMLITTPVFSSQLSLPIMFSVFGILVLSLFAGFNNPKSQLVIIFDFLVSVFIFIIFGYQSMVSYSGSYMDLFFLCNLLLALLSLFTVYFSSKTLRGYLLS